MILSAVVFPSDWHILEYLASWKHLASDEVKCFIKRKTNRFPWGAFCSTAKELDKMAGFPREQRLFLGVQKRRGTAWAAGHGTTLPLTSGVIGNEVEQHQWRQWESPVSHGGVALVLAAHHILGNSKFMYFYWPMLPFPLDVPKLPSHQIYYLCRSGFSFEAIPPFL